MLAFVPKKVIIYHLASALLCCTAANALAGLPTRNMNPFSIYVGLPEMQSATKLMEGQQILSLNTALNSHFVQDKNTEDNLSMDGESYVGEFSWQQGFSGWEGTVVIPYISYQPGFMDAAIINWHNAFHLPGDDRDKTDNNQLLIGYRHKNDSFLLDQPAQGIGDIRLTAGKQISRKPDYQHSLHLTVKLPSGDYHDGLGSGGTDIALFTTHAWQQHNWQEMLQAGVIGMEQPKILASQRRDAAVFFSASLDYAVVPEWVFTVQYDMHSALYSGTRQPALGNAVWLSTGLRHQLQSWAWHFVVIEDAGVHTAPDVGFQFGLQFGDVAYQGL
jgi:hypothetical protein